MEECTIKTVFEKAELWKTQGKSWHFHLVTPDCAFNPQPGRFALVLENNGDSQTYVVYSDEPLLKVDLALRDILHGDLTVEHNRDTSNIGVEKIGVILQQAKRWNERQVFWHHHMLFPDCVFNQHQGKWNIIIEDNENGELLQAVYDEEPIADLAEVEYLFFDQDAIKSNKS